MEHFGKLWLSCLMQLTKQLLVMMQIKAKWRCFSIAILWYMVMNQSYLLCDLQFFIHMSHLPFLPTIMILFHVLQLIFAHKHMLFALVDIEKGNSFDGKAWSLFFPFLFLSSSTSIIWSHDHDFLLAWPFIGQQFVSCVRT